MNSTKVESILSPTIDVCFEKLMDNPKVRKGFIAAILAISPEAIKETILMKRKTERSSIDEKYGILDVKILLFDGTIMNLEMQVRKYNYWDKRILFYMGKALTSQLHTKDDYGKMKKCIHASVLNFIQFPEDEKCYRKIALCDVETGEMYTDMLEIHIMELQKLAEDTKTDLPIIRWMKFLNCQTREEFESMKNIDEYIQEAYEELVKLSADKEVREEYEEREKILRDHYSFLIDAKEQGLAEGRAEGRAQGLEQGRAQGLEQGLAEGRAQGLALAKQVIKALKAGKSVEEISKIYNLPVEEINEILE